MKKLFLFVAALSVCALAAESSLEERVDGLTAQIDRVMSKAGIHFNGEFRSQFLSSTVDGDALAEFGKKTESVEYTSVDFNVVARPNTVLSARAMFRLHQDWRNFFSDVQNPITTRWLSIDGSVAQGIFKYNLGDYRKKLTPLTIWSPDVEVPFEPEIFSQGRELAMSEVFLGDNNRALQGGNLEFKAEVYPYLSELHADLFAARLATRGTGESDPIAPEVTLSPTPNGAYWDSAAYYDKYLVGVNLEAQIIKGAGLGIANVSIFDHVDSWRGKDLPDAEKGGLKMGGAFEDSAKFYSTSNNIFTARLNADNRAFMADDFVRFGVNAELAFSSYKYHNEFDSSVIKKADGVGDSTLYTVGDRSIDGRAINVGLSAKFNFDETNTLSLSLDYILNDTAFINEAAQSPSFVQRAILNNENLMAGNLGVLNPFDAMYRSVFKYTPSQYFGQSRPYMKNAYTNGIFNKKDIATLQMLGNTERFNVFQAYLPGGLATADRTGPVVKLDGSFLDEAVKVGVRAASLNGTVERILSYGYMIVGENPDDPDDGKLVEGDVALTPTYLTAGGGVTVDVAKFVPILGPSLKIGGSVMMYNSTIGWVEPGILYPTVSKRESASQLISGEVVYNFFTRFSFLFGYQALTLTEKIDVNEQAGPEETYTFSNLGVGLGYKVADGGALTVKLTMLSGEGPVGKDDDGNTKSLSYSAMQPEVYLTVKF